MGTIHQCLVEGRITYGIDHIARNFGNPEWEECWIQMHVDMDVGLQYIVLTSSERIHFGQRAGSKKWRQGEASVLLPFDS